MAPTGAPAVTPDRTGGVGAATRPRVLHVIGSLDGGGAERVLLTVLHGLPEVTHALAAGAGGALLPLVPTAIPVSPAATARELAELMATWRPEVVHTWLDGSLLSAIVPAAHLGVPVVHRLYNVPSGMAAHERHEANRREQMRHALGATTAVCALSSAAADDAVAYYGIARPRVVLNGVPLAGARGNTAAAPRRRGPVVLAVGRLAPEKGHTHLIDAVARLSGRHPSLELWLAGVGRCEPALRAQVHAARLDSQVRFLGFCEDVNALYAAADVFVCPSLTEGFGNAVAEALTAGVPVVASDLPAIRHDMLADAPGARLVPAADPASLAAALDELLCDAAARATLAATGRIVARRLGVERMLADYQALYADLAELSRAAA